MILGEDVVARLGEKLLEVTEEEEERWEMRGEVRAEN